MKIFFGVVIFSFLALPAFSQAGNVQRYRNLADTMANTITASTATLAEFDQLAKDDGALKNYTAYRRQYDSLAKALLVSEERLNFLLRTNDRTVFIKEERDNYERLLNELQSVKSEYDNWLSTAQ